MQASPAAEKHIDTAPNQDGSAAVAPKPEAHAAPDRDTNGHAAPFHEPHSASQKVPPAPHTQVRTIGKGPVLKCT